MRHIETDFIHKAVCKDCLVLHDKIIADFYTHLDGADTIKSHFFKGRFENIYLSANKISGMQKLLDHIQKQAASLLHTESADLKMGFWFNLMRQGDVTLPHSHDDDDELLSGAYYLQMPTGSGKLLIHLPDTITNIDPIEGQLVFFHPAVEHEVTQHASEVDRISLGFNIGVAY